MARHLHEVCKLEPTEDRLVEVAGIQGWIDAHFDTHQTWWNILQMNVWWVIVRE